jgi:hypothetical protein
MENAIREQCARWIEQSPDDMRKEDANDALAIHLPLPSCCKLI